MRQAFSCLFLEAQPGSLAELRSYLEGWRIDCRALDLAAPTAADADLLLIELGANVTPQVAAALAVWRATGRPTLGLCPAGADKALSAAVALGIDDLLTVPLDAAELRRRLELLVALGELTAERRRRAALFAPYLAKTKGQQFAPDSLGSAPRPVVVMLGEPEPTQVQMVAALPPAELVYLEKPAPLTAILQRGAVDLLLVTRPKRIAAALEAMDRAGGLAPMLLAAHAGPPGLDELPPQIDLLQLPVPILLARQRLALALRVGGLRRWLRAPPLEGSAPLLLDALTGLYNQGAFLDYLRAAGEDAALVALAFDRLDELNLIAGYATGNRALAQLGAQLQRALRAEDFAAHLGGGRFAVAVSRPGRQQLERMCRRLQLEVGEGLLAGAEALPVRGAPAHRLARLFGDLRRLRPAA
ncbi:MAG: diguanylate cyclase domain-containing protein [Geminicoccaceae bacterium]